MATWTTIPNSNLEPNAPARSIDALALRDNPVAIAEGASGAPKITNAAFDDNELGAERFQSGTTERDWVLARNADAGVGAIGTYAFCDLSSGTALPGDVEAGSNLKYSNGDGGITDGSLAGSWRCMGSTVSTGTPTLFLRIS